MVETGTEVQTTRVRGWLAFYCVMSVYVAPVLIVLMTVFLAILMRSMSASMRIKDFFLILFMLASMGVGMYVGRSLQTLRPHAVRDAKIFQLVSLAISVVFWIVGGHPQWGSTLGSILWFFYFEKSKQVEALFPNERKWIS